MPPARHRERVVLLLEPNSRTADLDPSTTAIMASTSGASTEKSYFEHQRELLIGDVAASLENVLQNMNRLNRSLEGVIAVWSSL